MSFGNLPRKFTHPGKFRAFGSVQLFVERLPVGFFALGILFSPTSQSPVVGKTSSTGASFKPALLDVVQIEPDFVREDRHLFDLDSKNALDTRSRTTWEIEQRRRAASLRSQSARSGSRFTWKLLRLMSSRITQFTLLVKFYFCSFG